MFTPSPKPARDGRADTTTSTFPGGSIYNEPIDGHELDIVNDVVGAAEKILPTLPEHEQFATNALFIAAERVLPRYGFDIENAPPHISRLIFKIGGERTGATIGDKFRNVLQHLTIGNLDAFADYTCIKEGNIDIVELAEKHNRNKKPAPSVTSVTFSSPDTWDASVAVVPPQSVRPSVRRRHSNASLPDGRPVSSSSSASSATSSCLSNHPWLKVPAEFYEKPLSQVVGGPRQGTPVRPKPHRSGIPILKSRRGSLSSVPTVSSVSAAAPTPAPALIKPEPPKADHDDLEVKLKMFQKKHGITSRPVSFKQSSAPAPFRPELPKVDYDDLEAKLKSIREKHDNVLLDACVAEWQDAAVALAEKKEFSEKLDMYDLLTEACEVWQEEAGFARDARKRREHKEWVDKMERRANRVYEICTARDALARWQAAAKQERDRTAVARRHLVRKRAFEGWRDEHIRVENKVRKFQADHYLKKWGEAALENEVRKEVADQWRCRRLLKNSVNFMLKETKERQADNVYANSLAKDALATWSEKARELQEEGEVAAAVDKHVLLDEAVGIWREEADDQQVRARLGQRLLQLKQLKRGMDRWREKATLVRRLIELEQKRAAETKQEVLDTWKEVSKGQKTQAEKADAFAAKEHVEHWDREMKLKLWRERDEHETKIAVVERWSNEEKLAWLKRRHDTQNKKNVLNTMLLAARKAQDERLRQEDDADALNEYYTQAGALNTWKKAHEKADIGRQNANLVNLYRTGKPAVDYWRERFRETSARGAYCKRVADKSRKRSLVKGVLEDWRINAKQARRDRLMSRLRQFRRQYKVDLAQSCLDKWQDAAADALDAKADADQINIEYKRADINDGLDHWRDSAKRNEDINNIAADAELEVYTNKWQDRLDEHRENMQDAVDYDAEKTRAQTMEKWEVQALQQKSKRHMADGMKDRYDKRVVRQILGDWQQKAVPESAIPRLDFRQSTLAARRGVRQQLSRSTGPSQIPTRSFGSDHLAASQPAPRSIVFGRLAASQTASRSTAAFNPEKSSLRGTRPIPETPAISTASSRIPISIRPHDRENVNPNTNTLASSRAAVPASAPAPVAQRPSILRATNFRASTRTAPSTVPRVPTPPDLGPMSEFDEEPFDPDSDGADMSTPTKLARGGGPGGYRYTTTPSAVLPSPYERELRMRYGGLGKRGGFGRSIGLGGIGEESRED